MSVSAYPKSWVAEVLTHTDLNAQFAHIRNGVNNGCLFKGDAGQSVTEMVTFTATQTFTPASGVGVHVTTGGMTIVGNSTITGTLGGVTVLTVTTSATIGGTAVPVGTGTSGKSARWTDTGVVAAGSMDDNGTYVSHAAQPRCTATGTSGTVGNGGGTAAMSWTEVRDVSGMHDNGSNPTRITIPADAGGEYLLLAHVNVLTGGADSNWTAAWRKGGSTIVPSATAIAKVYTNAAGTGFTVAATIDAANAADYYELLLTNNTGTNGTAAGQAMVIKLW